MRKKLLALLLVPMLIASLTMGLSSAESDEDDKVVSGSLFDLAVNVTTGVLSIVLFTISAIAYRHEARGRLLYVMGAFALFAVKSVTIALGDVANSGLLTGLFTQQIQQISSLSLSLARLFDFGILLLFFFGLASKK